MKTALVTGGAGFIGSHFCERLLCEGWSVICLDNLITGRRENIRHLLGHPRFRFLRRNAAEPIRLPKKVQAVCHLASPASPVDFERFPIPILKAGGMATWRTLGVAKKYRATYLLASTSEVYGDPETRLQREDYWGRVNPVGPRSAYDESKRFAEALAVAYRKSHGLSVRIARIFNTYGPRMRTDDGRAIPEFIRCGLMGRPIPVYGSGRQTRSFCFVTDLVEGLYRLLNTPSDGPVNLGNPREVTVLEVARKIQAMTGGKSPIRFRPARPDDPRRRCPDIGKARRLLKWEPKISFTDGLAATVHAFQMENSR